MAPGSRSKRRGKGAQAPGVSSEPLSLCEIDALPSAAAKRAAMLARIDETRALAKTRSYVNKRGEERSTPCIASMQTADKMAIELLGIEPAPAQQTARGTADLSVFNGGQSADRKAG